MGLSKAGEGGLPYPWDREAALYISEGTRQRHACRHAWSRTLWGFSHACALLLLGGGLGSPRKHVGG